MKLTDKIQAWMKAEGLSQDAVESLTGVHQSKVSEMLNRGTTNNFRYIQQIQGEMARKYPGATLDWLANSGTDWPPPKIDPRAVLLTEAERKVLEYAHDVSEGDPELKIARRRLMGLPPTLPAGPLMPDSGQGAASRDARETRGPNKGRRGNSSQ